MNYLQQRLQLAMEKNGWFILYFIFCVTSHMIVSSFSDLDKNDPFPTETEQPKMQKDIGENGRVYFTFSF